MSTSGASGLNDRINWEQDSQSPQSLARPKSPIQGNLKQAPQQFRASSSTSPTPAWQLEGVNPQSKKALIKFTQGALQERSFWISVKRSSVDWNPTDIQVNDLMIKILDNAAVLITSQWTKPQHAYTKMTFILPDADNLAEGVILKGTKINSEDPSSSTSSEEPITLDDVQKTAVKSALIAIRDAFEASRRTSRTSSPPLQLPTTSRRPASQVDSTRIEIERADSEEEEIADENNAEANIDLDDLLDDNFLDNVSEEEGNTEAQEDLSEDDLQAISPNQRDRPDISEPLSRQTDESRVDILTQEVKEESAQIRVEENSEEPPQSEITIEEYRESPRDLDPNAVHENNSTNGDAKEGLVRKTWKWVTSWI